MMTTTVQTIDTRIGKLDFELDVPTSETAAKLYDEMDFQRAVQCYLWGLPTVGMEELKQGILRDTGAWSVPGQHQNRQGHLQPAGR